MIAIFAENVCNLIIVEAVLMETKPKTTTKSKLIGTLLTLIGVAGLIYAAMCQFVDGMDKSAAAGILLLALVITFIGIGQLYKKHPDDY